MYSLAPKKKRKTVHLSNSQYSFYLMCSIGMLMRHNVIAVHKLKQKMKIKKNPFKTALV